MQLSKEKITIIINDIRIWILFFFFIRLIGITNAPLEIGHNWRQSLTNMIARNFLEGNANLLYPQIDMAGNLTGIIGSEFPVFNYLMYLVSLIFGYSHWYGRLINLLVSSVGVYFFYLFIEKITLRKIAFTSSIILIVSIWFGFSRKIMPDTFSVSLVIIGLYYGYRYLISGSLWRMILFLIFVTLGMLSKIPALSLMAAIPVLFMIREIPLNRRIIIMFLSVISVSIVGWWYFNWVPYLVSTYHFQLYFPKTFTEGLKEIIPLLPKFFEQFYFNSLCSFTALALMFIGLFFIVKSLNRNLIIGIILITVTFLVFILKTGAVFPLHSYYIIPFTPVMALIAGYGLVKIPDKFMYIILILIALEGTANQQHDFFIKNSVKYKLTLDDITAKYIGKNDFVVINGGQSPQMMYFAHRKGWTINDEKINFDELQQLKESGASYLIVDKNSFKSSVEGFRQVFSDTNFDIYSLK